MGSRASEYSSHRLTPARIRQPHQPFVDPDDHPPKRIVKPAFTALLDPMGSQRLSEVIVHVRYVIKVLWRMGRCHCQRGAGLFSSQVCWRDLLIYVIDESPGHAERACVRTFYPGRSAGTHPTPGRSIIPTRYTLGPLDYLLIAYARSGPTTSGGPSWFSCKPSSSSSHSATIDLETPPRGDPGRARACTAETPNRPESHPRSGPMWRGGSPDQAVWA
jgi:hypothetical protein